MVNITVTSNNSLLHRVTIPNTDLENNSASFNWSPQKSIAEDCSTLRISVSAVSDAHGESELAQIDVQLLKGKESDWVAIIMISLRGLRKASSSI